MIYNNIYKAVFVARPNRFIAKVLLNGEEIIVHVKNTGRCKELLVPGCIVYLEHFDLPTRKTKYDLVAVEKGNLLINMDSQAPNKVVGEWLLDKEPFGKIVTLKPEYTYGKSRFDFYMELENKKMFIEVKGVTLEENGIVLFPDAPTERGLKHIEELRNATQDGYACAIIFVVQMRGVRYFTPNRKTQPAFADALIEAQKEGVQIFAFDCCVDKSSLQICEQVKVVL